MKLYVIGYEHGSHELSMKAYRTKKKALRVLYEWAHQNGWHVGSLLDDVEANMGQFFISKIKVVL